MRLLTLYQKEQLLKNGSRQERCKDQKPVVKLFLSGTGCTWLLTQIDPEEPNIAFGLCDVGIGLPELAYVELDGIMSVKNKIGLSLEKSLSFKGKFNLSAYARAALKHGCIIDDETIVAKYDRKTNPKCKCLT